MDEDFYEKNYQMNIYQPKILLMATTSLDDFGLVSHCNDNSPNYNLPNFPTF